MREMVGFKREAYSEVECDLRALVLDISVEARFLVCSELVGEGGRGYKWYDASHEAA
jgi:hypothetical protein